MCGIVGIYNFERENAVDSMLLKKMADQLRHRGPDNEGYFVHGNIGLGFRRLSIIDLSPAGNQPLSNEDGTVWIIFNGEIYNFQELRQKLIGHGHFFRTRTDTETIVHLYEEEGIDCLRHLNGMFAFALWDTKRSTLYIARDRLGIKPLCYYKDNNHFIFASEIKAILQDPSVPREVNRQALHDYLHFMSVPQQESMFRGIEKLLPGHYTVINNSHPKTEQYWDVPVPSDVPKSDQHYYEELEHRFQSAVTGQLMSDVPLGAFLSGGVDSSSVVAMMKRSSSSVKTFSIALKGERNDESAYARQVATHLGTEHQEFNIVPNLIEAMPKVAWHMDEPFAVPSAFATYFLSRMTRNAVTVALSGDGGDELFAGYAFRLHLDETIRRMRFFPLPLRILGNKMVSGLPLWGSASSRERIFHFKRFSSNIAHHPDEAYISALTLFDDKEKNKLYANRIERSLDMLSPQRVLTKYYNERSFGSPLQKRLYADIKTNLVDEMLTKVDRMSMAAGLEVRVPFLDHELVEFAMTIPDRLKLQRKEGKIILKHIMEKYLPHDILYRPKQGFNLPIDRWFRKELYGYLNETLSDEALRRHGFFNPAAVRKLIRMHKESKGNYGIHLYALLSFQLWYETFIHQ